VIGQALPGHSLPLVADAVLFAAAAGFAVHHFGLMSLPSVEAVGERITVP
jgi:hypothetical protein